MKKTKKRKRHPVFSISFRVVAVMAAVTLAFSYISPFINPEHFSIASIFGLYFIPILAINIILLIMAKYRRSRSFWIPLIAILPSFVYLTTFINISGSREGSNADQGIKLLTYNVGRFKMSESKMNRALCLENITEVINNETPDIVCLQEFEIADSNEIKKIYPEYPYHKYHFFRFRNNLLYGNITLSRHPITNSGNIEFPKSTNVAIFSDIRLNGRSVRVYNCHLESFNISLMGLVKSLFHSEEDHINELIDVHDKVRNTNRRRSAQVSRLLDHIHGSSLPSIFCGDFNDTPLSYCYQSLIREHTDSFREKGNGFAATYRMLWPLLRIDYILLPSDSKVIRHRTLTDVNYSDHYPVTSTFSF